MAIDVARSVRIRARKHLRPGSTPAARPEPALDRDYWVAHCEGYRVDGDEGRIGFVEEVRPNPADSTTPLLAIRAGMLGRHILVVSANDVQSIAPRSQHIRLRSPLTLL